jgi:hypothetical protein
VLRAHGGWPCSWRCCGLLLGTLLRVTATLGGGFISRRGVATQLIQAFEARAREHGCSTFYLETFSFQTPHLYELLGYTVAYEHKVDPHRIVKYVMVKHNQNAT